MATRTGLRAILRSRDFRVLYATRLIAQAADGVFQVGLADYVLFSPDKASTPGKTAAAFAVLLLPYSIVGPFAGVFIDRWSRQRILQWANVVRAGLVVVVAALVASGAEGVWFYIATLSVLSVNRFVLASLSAALPHVLPEEDLVTGNSLATTSGTIVAITGGGVGFAVRHLLGKSDGDVATIVLCAGVGYLGAAAVARRMAVHLLGPDHDPSRPETVEALRRVLAGVADGARHVWSHRHAAYGLLAITAHRFCYGLSTVATLLLYRNYFRNDGILHGGLAGLGQVFAASAAGVLVAAMVTPPVTRRIGTEQWVTALLATAAVAEASLGFPYTKLTMLGAALVLGFVAQGTKICVDTIVQTSIDDDFRGRVFSFYDIVFNIAFVAAAAVGAVVLPVSGKSYAVLAGITAGYAVTAAGYATAVRRRGRRP